MIEVGDMVELLSWKELYARYGRDGILDLRSHGTWSQDGFIRFEDKRGIVMSLHDDFYHIYIEGLPESVRLYFSEEVFKEV